MGADPIKDFAAVSAQAVHSTRLSAHHRQQAVNGGHQQGTQAACLHCVARDRPGRLDAQISDGTDEDNTEGQRCRGIHRVVAIQDSLEKAHMDIGTGGLQRGGISHGPQQGCDRENPKKQQK